MPIGEIREKDSENDGQQEKVEKLGRDSIRF